MHILFAGGGTAGHVNPALAVAGCLKENFPDCKISFIGTQKGIESRLVKLAGYDFYTIDIAGFQRKITVKNIIKNVSTVKKVFTSSKASKKLLVKLKPDLVMGTGGYVCGPVVREAAKLGIPSVVHEANAYPGVTIKMLAPKVDKTLVAMKDALKHLNPKNPPVLTGNPIRKSLTLLSKEEAKSALGLDQDVPMILSFGGSLGARIINDSIFHVIKSVHKNPKFYLYHGTGKSAYNKFCENLSTIDFDENNKHIKVLEYIDNMDVMLAAADLVVCRAGAMTVNELQVCGKPSILIPSPYVAENHQYHNALSLKNVGAADLIEEKDLTGEILLQKINSLLSDNQALGEMSVKAKSIAINNADELICSEILDLLK